MKVYVISFFGTEKLRQKRKDIHQEQIDWLTTNGFDVHVLAQDYQDDEFDDRVTYVNGNQPRQYPVYARNQLFKHFYSTNDDYALFLDNDIVVECLSTANIIDEISKKIELFLSEKVGLITFMNPGFMPTKKKYSENQSQHDSYILFEKESIFFKESALFMVNWKKHINEEFQVDYDLLYPSTNEMANGESMLMSEQCFKHQWHIMRSAQLVMKELNTSSTWGSKQAHRRNITAAKAMAKRLGWQYKIDTSGKFLLPESKKHFPRQLKLLDFDTPANTPFNRLFSH